jgi:hypothetical protein
MVNKSVIGLEKIRLITNNVLEDLSAEWAEFRSSQSCINENKTEHVFVIGLLKLPGSLSESS